MATHSAPLSSRLHRNTGWKACATQELGDQVHRDLLAVTRCGPYVVDRSAGLYRGGLGSADDLRRDLASANCVFYRVSANDGGRNAAQRDADIGDRWTSHSCETGHAHLRD